MDLGLYLISGILLIFILEQFVQIGLMMRNTNSVYGGTHGGNSGTNYYNDYTQPMMYPPPNQQMNSQMYNPQMYNQVMQTKNFNE